jgi:hypothetical protein
VLMLVGTRLPVSRLEVMGWSAGMGIVLLRVAISGVVHRRLRRRVMVVCVGVVFLLAPRWGIHGRALAVHVWLAWPGRHVVVHHAAGGEERTRPRSRRPAQPSAGEGGAEVGVVGRPCAHIDKKLSRGESSLEGRCALSSASLRRQSLRELRRERRGLASVGVVKVCAEAAMLSVA